MIAFKNLSNEVPYKEFKDKYDEAVRKGQKGLEVISISSFNAEINEVDSRYVNLKFIDNDQFIFFSNYNSPKSRSFSTHKQISALIYWPNINLQIRMRAKIRKTSIEFNQKYFSQRLLEKNALAISSNQSSQIDTYSLVKKNFSKVLKNNDLKKCPEYWGGFSFTPYAIEFWTGHENRLNKRDLYEKVSNSWKHSILQP
ncbi:pyridoxamine 5'-phosphate oxidase family protein [Gammaproteobacteria bacterium]|nr:pyridoxamine 5'-phosphate oxidase family protein [Gammaproteobacteria bacterium]